MHRRLCTRLPPRLLARASICSQRYSFHRGAIDVYVDGVRFAGTHSEATTYAQFIDERCDKANGLFKDRGQPPVAQYVFNGVAFDHNAHTVCLGPRVIRKLRADSFFNISFVDLEAVVGRLIYGSAVLRLNMPRFYFALKVAQRRINLLNRCPKLCDRPVALPVVTRSMLAEWRNELLENVPRSPTSPSRCCSTQASSLHRCLGERMGSDYVFRQRRGFDYG